MPPLMIKKICLIFLIFTKNIFATNIQINGHQIREGKNEIEEESPLKSESKNFDKFCSEIILEKLANELAKNKENGSTKMSIQIGLRHFLCKEIGKMEKEEEFCEIEGGNGKIECWKRIFKKKSNEKGKERMKEEGEIIWQKNGSNYFEEFKFTVYLGKEFRKLRKSFGISAFELLESMANLEGYKTTTAGGSDFFFSADKRFLLKKVQTEELGFFIESKNGENAFNGAFADYSKFMKNSPNSLLPKFFMLFRVECENIFGKNLGKTFLLMDSLFSKEILENLNYKFDLKGAVINRRATKGEWKLHGELPTLRDLDFCRFWETEMCHFDKENWWQNGKNEDGREEMDGIFPNGIEPENWEDFKKFKKIIEADLRFLVAHNIMDYSLLIGIQIVKKNEQEFSKK